MYGEGVRSTSWATTICSVASFMGTAVNPDGIGRLYRGDVVAALLDMKLIKQDGDRYASLI